MKKYQKLYELRKKFSYSCQDMAEKLEISSSYYWQIENGHRRLFYDIAVKIADVFKLKPDDIFYY
ncbi:TPA: helix-turn-helix transcriptional regulator [Candidatus Ventrenecus avicola]|nr:helix-turn-helix transcriptional regulator [Candidatus Ventrenecus avicola]